MLSFEWRALVSHEVLDELLAEAPGADAADKTALRKAVALVLRRRGGAPVVDQPLSPEEQRWLVRYLVGVSVMAALGRGARTRRTAVERARAKMKPEGRRSRRWDGPVLDAPCLGAPLSASFAAVVRGLQARAEDGQARHRADARDKALQPRMPPLRAAIVALMRSAVGRLPWRQQLIDRRARQARIDADQLRVSMTSGRIALLEDRQYYVQLPKLIVNAQKSVDVCMFHIAFSSPDHPTVKILDALATAQQSGAVVRVLMDQDRKKDPYKSLIINTPAHRYLVQRGVACRFDDSALLLHSKYLVLDREVVVMGSHNWSAGSYFNYRDLSFAVHSSEFAQQLTKRFEGQWRKGSDKPRDDDS